MLIVCPNCAKTYLVRAIELGSKDRLVRCGACQTSWRPDEMNVEARSEPMPDPVAPPFQADHAPSSDLSAKPPEPRLRARLGLVRLGATAAAVAGLSFVALNDQAGSLFSRAIDWIDANIPGNGLQGISLTNLKTSIEAEQGEVALTIEGEIRSDSKSVKTLPSLRFTMRDEAQNTIFQWMIPAPAATIAKGEALPFKARLASPPRDAKNISIAFSGA
jgi:predicted Zn finger-like uncharacterized protein